MHIINKLRNKFRKHDHIFVLTDLMSLHRTHNLNQTHKTLNHFHKSKAKYLSIIRQLKVIVAEILGFMDYYPSPIRVSIYSTNQIKSFHKRMK
ncbi:transposase [Lactobacillus sp. B4015]|uniref:transposase n=1 Tax=unclassified Lactobacillus TaxID=2620435 RepID=UPI003834244E|nr:transposase [Lactobacillus sp. B4015]MCX8735501.1 transposase [Lactobacillus sp. B4012]